MITAKTIELIKNGKVLGTVSFTIDFPGKEVIILVPTTLKRLYNRRYETITVPIAYDYYYDDGVECRMKRFLDVSKKSKRQIELIKKHFGGL